MRPLIAAFVICWTLTAIDARYDQIPKPATERSIDDALIKWKEMENNFKIRVNNLFQRFVPVLVSASSDVVIGNDCMVDLAKIGFGIRKLRLWAFKLLDAIGKPEGGQLDGTPGAYGSYHECVNIEFPVDGKDAIPTTGQYCMIDIRPPLPPKPPKVGMFGDIFKGAANGSMTTEVMAEFQRVAWVFYHNAMRIAVCAPSTCTKTDLNNMIAIASKRYGMNSQVFSCEVKEKFQLDSVQISIIGVFAFFLMLNIIATNMDCFDNGKESLVRSLIQAFSIRRNVSKTVDDFQSESNRLKCLFGLRVISMTWIILSHTYVGVTPMMMKNALNFENIRKQYVFQFVPNGFLAVDTFFVITGVLLSYVMVGTCNKRGPISLPVMLIRRIWRLLPSVMLMAGICICLPAFGSGPMWHDITDYLSQTCRNNWWLLPIFGNNFIVSHHMCNPVSWYVSVDLQLFVLFLVYCFIYARNQKIAKCYLVFIVFGSILSTGLVTYVMNFPPTLLMDFIDYEYAISYLNLVYSTPYPHAGSYALGLALGTYLANADKVQIKTVSLLIGSAVSALLLLFIAFGTQPWNNGVPYTQTESILYASFFKTVWGAVVAFVIFACVARQNGIVSNFLSWKVFVPLTKLSYLMYLVHMLFVLTFSATKHGSVDVNHYTFIRTFASNWLLSLVASFVLRVVFEGPLGELDRIVFSPNRKLKADDIRTQSTNIVEPEKICNNKIV